MNKSKARGTAAETAVLRYARANGQPFAVRNPPAGNKDVGDIGLPGVAIEVKSCGRFDLAGWLDEATLEAANAGVDIGVVWFKRRGTTDPGKWYVLMDGATFMKLLEP